MYDLLSVFLDQDAKPRVIPFANAQHDFGVGELGPVHSSAMQRYTLLRALEPVLRNGYGTHTLCNPTVLTRLRETWRVLWRLFLTGWIWGGSPRGGRIRLLWGSKSHGVSGLYRCRGAVVSPSFGGFAGWARCKGSCKLRFAPEGA
jgi:hypothetical protein